jgi:hypothetical protein
MFGGHASGLNLANDLSELRRAVFKICLTRAVELTAGCLWRCLLRLIFLILAAPLFPLPASVLAFRPGAYAFALQESANISLWRASHHQQLRSYLANEDAVTMFYDFLKSFLFVKIWIHDGRHNRLWRFQFWRVFGLRLLEAPP